MHDCYYYQLSSFLLPLASSLIYIIRPSCFSLFFNTFQPSLFVDRDIFLAAIHPRHPADSLASSDQLFIFF